MGRSLVVLGTLVLVLLGAGPASAEQPVAVSDRITDEVGALGGTAPAAREAVDELAAETGIDLYVVFVSSFQTQGGGDWVQQTARLSGLGDSDMLLAVAAGQETYEFGWWVPQSFPLSEVAVEDLVANKVEPKLTARDWGGAVVTLADELQAQAATEEEQATTPGWSATTTVLVIGAIAVVLVGAHLLSRRRSKAGSAS